MLLALTTYSKGAPFYNAISTSSPIYDAPMKKTPPDTMVDHAAMLLSTDWFAPYWTVIGLEADKQKQCLQNGCREIVRQVVGEARDYYLIDFSHDRIERTRNDLRLLVRNCKLGEAAAIRVEELVANKSGREQLGKTAWMFCNLHDELLNSPWCKSRFVNKNF